jgi:hypothetical protein
MIAATTNNTTPQPLDKPTTALPTTAPIANTPRTARSVLPTVLRIAFSFAH